MWRRHQSQVPDVPSWIIPLDNSFDNSKGAVCTPLLQNKPNNHLHDPVVLLNKESHISLAFKEKASTDLLRQHPDFRRCLRSLVRNKPKQATSWDIAKSRLERNILSMSFPQMSRAEIKRVAQLPRKSVPALGMPSSPTSHPNTELEAVPPNPSSQRRTSHRLCFLLWVSETCKEAGTGWPQSCWKVPAGSRPPGLPNPTWSPPSCSALQPLPGEQLQMFSFTFFIFTSHHEMEALGPVVSSPSLLGSTATSKTPHPQQHPQHENTDFDLGGTIKIISLPLPSSATTGMEVREGTSDRGGFAAAKSL